MDYVGNQALQRGNLFKDIQQEYDILKWFDNQIENYKEQRLNDFL